MCAKQDKESCRVVWTVVLFSGMGHCGTEAVHREMQLKKEIEKKDKTIKQDKKSQTLMS